jgi:small-conductance mechanosensitive channel
MIPTPLPTVRLFGVRYMMKRSKLRWRRSLRRWIRTVSTPWLGVLVLGMVIVTGVQGFSATAQLPNPTDFSDPLPLFKASTAQNEVESGWVRLDGRPVFRVAAPAEDLSQRIQDIQRNLADISRAYRESDTPSLTVELRGEADLPTLYVNDRYVMTVTHLDAQLELTTPSLHGERLRSTLRQAIQDAATEWQPAALVDQTKWAIALLGAMGTLSLGVSVMQRQWRKRRQTQPPTGSPVTSQITQRRQENLGAIQALGVQLSQLLIWGGGSLLILHLFPQTRWLQVWVVQRLPAYLSMLVIAVGTYVAVRASFVVIDWFIGTLVEGGLLTPNRDQRLQQRVSTISRVVKGMTVLLLVLIGIFVALINLGVDIAPLIAGAGLIGVAISLASQNLIRDAINGFLILVEDQYAVGDVIAVDKVFGMVENMTLRITQLRDPEQRLITIPNSEVKVVSNLSSRHSQSDIHIPVAYSANIDQVLDIVNQVGIELAADPDWMGRILAKPLNLGLDEFGDRGMVVRVWIRTQPLEQWNVAREYRRRVKRAFDQAKIPLMLSQQELWLHDAEVAIAPPAHPGVDSTPNSQTHSTP